MSKGPLPRPAAITREQYRASHDRVFGGPPPERKVVGEVCGITIITDPDCPEDEIRVVSAGYKP